MSTKWFTVKNDRFSLKEKDVYYLIGWKKKGVRFQAYWEDRPLEVKEVPLPEGSGDSRSKGIICRLEMKLTDLEESGGRLKIFGYEDGEQQTVFWRSARELRRKARRIAWYLENVSADETNNSVTVTGWAAAAEDVSLHAVFPKGSKCKAVIERHARKDVDAELFELEEGAKRGFSITVTPIPEKMSLKLTAGNEKLRIAVPVGKAAVFRYKASKTIEKGRTTLRARGISETVAKAGGKVMGKVSPSKRKIPYDKWIVKHLPTAKELKKQRETTFPVMPLFSVIVPCYRTPEKLLRETVESVKAQTYGKWELILSDGSGQESPIAELLTSFSKKDKRIKVVPAGKKRGISENTNAAIKEAAGDYLVFLDHDDLLTPDALFASAERINKEPELDLIYSDEDKVTEYGTFLQPNLKPDFAPDMLRSVNYICHMLVVRRAFAKEVGYMDPAFDGAQDHDFILRCTEKTHYIGHIRRILYHWRLSEQSTAADPESKTYAFEAGKKAVQAHLDRLGHPAHVVAGQFPGLYRVVWDWKEKPKVSVIIPNKDHREDLDRTITSLLEKTSWPDIEIIVAENNSTDEETFAYYEELKKREPRVKVITYKGEFNYSAINNMAAREATGDLLLLLNNDTEALSDVITLMAGFAMRGDVGAVGARLFYEDGTVQHAGVILGWGGVAGHAFVNEPKDYMSYQHRMIIQSDMSCVTAAAMMVPKKVFDQVGGLTEDLAVAFNDVDFCMKLRAAGYLIVYEPNATMIHYESKSRGYEDTPEKQARFNSEVAYFKKHWGHELEAGDPYYHPLLSMETQDFSLEKPRA